MRYLRYSMTFIMTAAVFSQMINVGNASGQSVAAHRPTFRGKYDSEFSFPVIEGRPGQKDPGALKEIQDSVSASSPLDWQGIEAKGTFTIGVGEEAQNSPATLVLEKADRYRFDIQTENGERSIRSRDGIEAIKSSTGEIRGLPFVQLGTRIILPSQLLEIVNRENFTVIDDGVRLIGGKQMHQVTVIYPIRPQLPGAAYSKENFAAVVFYFDPVTHFLLKSVSENSASEGGAQKMLKVITYGDYRTVQGASVPFIYFETNNGQPGGTFRASEVLVTSHHEMSYFQF